MTFPSSGCRTCKIRKIKCDETKPVCKKCIKSGRVCQGVTPQPSWSIVHIENDYASGQKKRPRGPRSTPHTEGIPSPAFVHQPAPCDLKTTAVTYYVNNHLKITRDAPSILIGVLNDFLSVWTSRSQTSLLDLSISSMALAVFSRIEKVPVAADAATHHYGRLLQLMQKMMTPIDLTNVDDCLLATFFMGRYEDARHTPVIAYQKCEHAASITSFSHHDGARAILKAWKSGPDGQCAATNVIKHTRRGLIRSALLRKLSIPHWMIDGAAFGETGHDLEYDSIVVRLANVRQKASALMHGQIHDLDAYDDFATSMKLMQQELKDIDVMMQIWATRFPLEWSYELHTVGESERLVAQDFPPQMLYRSSDPTVGAMWNLHFATRILINSTHLSVLDLNATGSSEMLEKQKLECVANIEDMANRLAGSLLKSLGPPASAQNLAEQSDTTAESLVEAEIPPWIATWSAWPLSLACGVEHVDSLRRAYFQTQLSRVGQVLGSGVLQCFNRTPWFKL